MFLLNVCFNILQEISNAKEEKEGGRRGRGRRGRGWEF